MPKKLFAVTNVKLDSNTFFNAGDEIDHSKFTKDQLRELHDQGAVEVRTVDDADSTKSSPNEDLEEASKVQPTTPNPATIEDPSMKVKSEKK